MRRRTARGGDGARRRVFVSAAPATPNGDLHLGHLGGPFLAADIHARYLRMRGVDAHYVVGEDIDQSWVLTYAEQLGLPPLAAAEQATRAQIETLEAVDVELSNFLRPRESPSYRKMICSTVESLHARGELEVRDTPAAFCDGCQRHLYETYVRGRCPHCDMETPGSFCEGCGYPNDASELRGARCARCDRPASLRRVRRLFFPLERHARRLGPYLDDVAMTDDHRALCEAFLSRGLPSIPVSRVGDWGIPVPIEGFEGQTINVWFEIGPGYLASAQDLAERTGLDGWRDFWSSDDGGAVLFFGTDNGFYQALLYPAIFFAMDEEIRPPHAFIMNHFYLLDGEKFSTSRNHAIWGRDLAARVPADLIRFYLCYDRPERESTSFTLAEFHRTIRDEVLDGWVPWLARLGRRALERGGGVAPAATAAEQGSRALDEIAALVRAAADGYESTTFSLRAAARALIDLGRLGRRLEAGDGAAVAGGRPALELVVARCLAMAATPMLPEFAHRLRCDLEGRGGPAATWSAEPRFLPDGHRIGDLRGPFFDAPETPAEIAAEDGGRP